MKIAATAILCFLMITAAQAMLRSGPEIVSAAIDQKDSNIIYLHISSQSVKAALSTNGGMNFQGIKEKYIPENLTTNLTLGTRRYVLKDWTLLRSDDGGLTWTNTGTASFLRKIANAEIEVERNHFWEEFGSRLPQQSVFWHVIFGVFAITYAVAAFCTLRSQGSFGAFLTVLRGLFMILLLWCFLWMVHSFFFHWAERQYPSAYWNTSAEFRPNAKTGLIMAIAARPLPLLVYLIALWPILPGSINVMLGPQPTTRRRNCASILAITIGTLFVLFNLCMTFVGYFRG
jgi:hypothetical protein